MNKTYMLIHKRLVEIHSDSENVYSTMLLGFFSSDIKCEEAIQYYLKSLDLKIIPMILKLKRYMQMLMILTVLSEILLNQFSIFHMNIMTVDMIMCLI